MGLFNRRTQAVAAAYVRAVEGATSGLENPSADLVAALSQFEGGPATAAGINVSPDSALRNIAVFSAVRVLAESVGSLPMHVYRRDGRSRIRVDDDREALLSEAPNPYQTAETFWSTLVGHANLWGNGYALRTTDDAGRPEALWLLDPRSTAPYRRKDGSLFYGSYVGGKTVAFDPADVIHIRGFGVSGDVGISPIGAARQAIGEALAAEQYAGRFFANDGKPGGVIHYERRLSEDQHREAVRRWNAMHQGVKKSHVVAVLDNGASWQDVGMPHADAQFLETRKFGVRQIASLYRVPPHMIGDLEGTVTYASIEQQAIDFVVHSLRPWIVRCEQAVQRVMFASRNDRQQKVYARFNVDALLRGDTKTRYEAYAIGRQWGWLSTNDVLELEDRPGIGEAGDDYLKPLNMATAGVDQAKLDETAQILTALGVEIPKKSE